MSDSNSNFEIAAHTPVGFAEAVLDLPLYPWQDEVLTWFEAVPDETVRGTLCTPNGAGKDDRVIATLALWWVTAHARGRVVITSKDSRQLDEQTYPALSKHRGKLADWKFIERYIETPTGGKIILFTTDEPGRAEGWHRENDPEGPLLIIVNEAKSVPEEIFQAFERCTYSALLYTSSPGHMHGTFWESHSRKELNFQRLKVGLADCPHIPPERIESITKKYGPRHPFTLSTLHGEFMLDGAESRFDFEGLEWLQRIAENTHGSARRGIISEHGGTFSFRPVEDGWAWISEAPAEGRAYLAFADPMKGEQSAGSAKRDTHACGVIREGYLDESRIDHPDELVAAIFVEDPEAFSGAACRWELSVLAHRLWLLAGYYGGCTIVPEENNYGGVLIKELLDLGADVWQREDPDHERTGRRTIRKYGFQTNTRTKRYWVEALAKAIFEQTFICRFKPAVAQFAAFIQNDDGTCEARPGAFDDFVAGVGIALSVGAYTRIAPPRVVRWPAMRREERTINRAVS
jgi:hypothetical protein